MDQNPLTSDQRFESYPDKIMLINDKIKTNWKLMLDLTAADGRFLSQKMFQIRVGNISVHKSWLSVAHSEPVRQTHLIRKTPYKLQVLIVLCLFNLKDKSVFIWSCRVGKWHNGKHDNEALWSTRPSRFKPKRISLIQKGGVLPIYMLLTIVPPVLPTGSKRLYHVLSCLCDNACKGP